MATQQDQTVIRGISPGNSLKMVKSTPNKNFFSCKMHTCKMFFLTVQNSSIGDLVTDWLTQSQYFYFWYTIKNNLWSLRHLITVTKHDRTNILTIVDNFGQFVTILIIFDNFQKFRQFFLTNLNFVSNFGHFWQFKQMRQCLTIVFLPFWQLPRQSWRLATFETLITILKQLTTWIQTIF